MQKTRIFYTQNIKPLLLSPTPMWSKVVILANINGSQKLVQLVKELEWNGWLNLQMASILSLLVLSKMIQFTLIRLFGKSIVLMVKSSGR
jgi:formate hydrogenlyase subunit 4